MRCLKCGHENEYKIAHPWNKRTRPEYLGPVTFGPVCHVCKKPITSKPCCELRKVT